MVRRNLHLTGSTSLARDDANVRVAEALSQSGAVLVDFSVFAHLSTLMRVELPARQIGVLGKRLRDSGLTLDASSEAALKSCDPAGEVTATLRIDFKREEPALATVG
jgi:hypothetical protein